MKEHSEPGELRSLCHRRYRPTVSVLAVFAGCLLDANVVSAAEVANSMDLPKQFNAVSILTFLFLMLGPFKIIAPFEKLTRGADAALTRRIALQAILFSSIALLIAAFTGEYILSRYGIPLPILALAAGIILFLVALQGILQQFAPASSVSEEATAPTLTLKQALTSLAFPTIVTPYGIAATIVFLAFSPDVPGRLIVGAIVLIIMLMNLVIMLNIRRIGPILSISLAILGAVIGVIQVALGLQIINNSLRALGAL
jgi:multiple antibiotic resistance protein